MTTQTKRRIAALLAGVLFGAGLAISGMTLPAKVLGFLDVTGDWDPSLAFVMMGAIGVHFFAARFALHRGAPFFGTELQLPTKKDLDTKLIAGAALFGIGWGLAGICPGPGIVSLVSGSPGVASFVGAMLVGMLLEHLLIESRVEKAPLPA